MGKKPINTDKNINFLLKAYLSFLKKNKEFKSKNDSNIYAQFIFND
jgi:hypothetical protein